MGLGMKSELPIILLSTSVILFLVSISTTKGNIILRDAQGTEFQTASGPYISFPANKTYDSGLLTLSVNFHAIIGGGVSHLMSYSLDGKKNETVPLIDHYFGFFKERGGQPEKNYWDGLVELPVLSNGTHFITVYLEGNYCNYYRNHSAYYETAFDSQTVYFTVLSPVALLMENQPYNSTEIPLNFYVNAVPPQILYSLDSQTNVTISGNTTLTGLTEGLHSINIYTPDEEGRWVNFDTATFIVTKTVPTPTSSPTPLLLIGLLSIATLAISVLLFFKRRKAKDMSSKHWLCLVKKRDRVKNRLTTG